MNRDGIIQWVNLLIATGQNNLAMEAESYDGPSLIVAYSHCIAHGYDTRYGLDQQKKAVQSGHWPLYRYDPRLAAAGHVPFQLDSKAPSIPLEDYIYNETRYRMLTQSNPNEARRLLALARQDVAARWQRYEHLASGAARGETEVTLGRQARSPHAAEGQAHVKGGLED